MKTFSLPLRRHFGLLALALAACVLAAPIRADEAAPTFSDPDVTAFVKAYGDFTDHYSADMKNYMAAVKSNDATKMQDAAKKLQENTAKSTDLQTKGAAMSGKLKPEEAQKYSAYMTKCAQKMADASK